MVFFCSSANFICWFDSIILRNLQHNLLACSKQSKIEKGSAWKPAASHGLGVDAPWKMNTLKPEMEADASNEFPDFDEG